MEGAIKTLECECGCTYTIKTGDGPLLVLGRMGFEFVDGQEAPVLMCECGRAMDYKGELLETLKAFKAKSAEIIAGASNEKLSEMHAVFENTGSIPGSLGDAIDELLIANEMKRRKLSTDQEEG